MYKYCIHSFKWTVESLCSKNILIVFFLFSWTLKVSFYNYLHFINRPKEEFFTHYMWFKFWQTLGTHGSESSLKCSCYTFCDTGDRFDGHLRGPVILTLIAGQFGIGTVTTCFNDLGLSWSGTELKYTAYEANVWQTEPFRGSKRCRCKKKNHFLVLLFRKQSEFFLFPLRILSENIFVPLYGFSFVNMFFSH